MSYLRRRKLPKKPNKRKAAKKLGYKSGLEQELHAGPLKECDYEPSTSRQLYTTEHYYYPDFVHPKAPNVLFEAKGRFRTYAEAQKYINVKRSNPELIIVFVFSNPHQRAYAQCKKRADGTVLSLAEWSEKNGFEWCTPNTIDLTRWIK